MKPGLPKWAYAAALHKDTQHATEQPGEYIMNIDWDRSLEMYRPVLGSKLTVSLVVLNVITAFDIV